MSAKKSHDPKSDPPRGRIPYPPIDAGLVARMKPADAKVYLVIAAHDWAESSVVKPSLDRIARLSGLTRVSVCRSIRHLEQLQAISVRRDGRGGYGHPNKYTLSGIPGVTVSRPKISEGLVVSAVEKAFKP